MDHKKLQDLKDRLDTANSAIAMLRANIDTMFAAAEIVGVFTVALAAVRDHLLKEIQNPLHRLEVDFYEAMNDAPEITVKNVSGECLKIFGRIPLDPEETYTMEWNARYSKGIRDLIEEDHLQEVVQYGKVEKVDDNDQ